MKKKMKDSRAMKIRKSDERPEKKERKASTRKKDARDDDYNNSIASASCGSIFQPPLFSFPPPQPRKFMRSGTTEQLSRLWCVISVCVCILYVKESRRRERVFTLMDVLSRRERHVRSSAEMRVFWNSCIPLLFLAYKYTRITCCLRWFVIQF